VGDGFSGRGRAAMENGSKAGRPSSGVVVLAPVAGISGAQVWAEAVFMAMKVCTAIWGEGTVDWVAVGGLVGEMTHGASRWTLEGWRTVRGWCVICRGLRR
jgi:hypothetical protein